MKGMEDSDTTDTCNDDSVCVSQLDRRATLITKLHAAGWPSQGEAKKTRISWGVGKLRHVIILVRI